MIGPENGVGMGALEGEQVLAKNVVLHDPGERPAGFVSGARIHTCRTGRSGMIHRWTSPRMRASVPQ